MKKLLLIGALSLFLVGCEKSNKSAETKTNENQATQTTLKKKTYYSYLDNLDTKDMEHSSAEFDLAYDKENPEEIKGLSTNIFIARVVSLDKSDSPSNDKKTDMDVAIPYTYGKLEILQNILGEAPKEADFTRLGGIMTEKELYKNDHKEFVEKLNRNRKKNGIPLIEESDRLIETLGDEDFHLKAGEVYLFYAHWDKDWEKYELVGFENGALPLEEGNQPIEKTKLAKNEVGKSWKIKNKKSGKKEVLSEYLENKAKVKVRKK